MADAFELYHIPQQSRRDRLRVQDLQGCAGLGLLPLYDASSLLSSSPNLLSCANASADYGNVRPNNESLDCNFVYAHDQDRRLTQPHQPLALSLSSHSSNGGLKLQRYESVLKGSKFLKPARQLLDEICDVGFGLSFITDPPPFESLRTTSVDNPSPKNSRLIALLHEVYKRYKEYYQQVQAVIVSFETVAGLSSAAPFANLDLKAMSKHFRSLSDAITDQLRMSTKPREHKEELLYGQNMGYVDHQPVWRPQRGLPKRAVTVLRAWLFDHFLHPYPTDTDKQMLAKQTGLSRNQVSNWFINARVRLWKPMVEEVHTLETRQVCKETSPHGNSLLSHQRNQDPPSKRSRNDFQEHMKFYETFSINNRGVSLTLGLHQNNAVPLNGQSFVMGGFDAQNRQIIGGQFLHDFGG